MDAKGIYHKVNELPYVQRWSTDVRFRVIVRLVFALVCNVSYAIWMALLGYAQNTYWYYAFTGYYGLLALIRVALLVFTCNNKPYANRMGEYCLYRACGCVLLVINVVLLIMVAMMAFEKRMFDHTPVTAIALATYTVISFTVSIVKAIKYRQYNNAIFSASKLLTLTASFVSLISLTVVLLTVFGRDTVGVAERNLVVTLTGVIVAAVILTVAIRMIVRANRRIRELNLTN